MWTLMPTTWKLRCLERLGRFEIIRELGRGAFGIVFLADDQLLRRQVVLKVPRPEAR